jgi:hypothetical protein
MTQNSLQKVNDRLAKLHGYAYFRPESGPLKERLTEAVLEGLDGDAAEQLSETPFGLEVNIGQQEGDTEVSVGFSVDYPGVEYRSQLPLDLLSQAELEDLFGYLASTPEEVPAAESAPAGTTVLRKKPEDDEYLEKGPAAGRLKVSPEWLKSVVPCTEYSYEEIEGKKYIREYYWSRELIERLFRIKSTKTTPEDLQYVAKECCEGDLDWARDLIGRLKSPNRPEPAPRDHSQKGQAKGAAMKAQQGRQVQAKPASPKAQPPKQGNVSQGAGNPAGSQGAPAGPAGEQRSRNRSRHRKPFRGEGKDRKPEQGGQKQPQQ